MTKDDFKDIRKRIRAAYPGGDVMSDKETFDLWYERLGSADYEILNRGVNAYIDAEKYPPTISDIRRYTTAVHERDNAIRLKIAESFSQFWSLYPKSASQISNRGKYEAKCFDLFLGLTVGKYGYTSQAIDIAARIAKRGILQTQMIDLNEREYIPLDAWLREVKIE